MLMVAVLTRLNEVAKDMNRCREALHGKLPEQRRLGQRAK